MMYVMFHRLFKTTVLENLNPVVGMWAPPEPGSSESEGFGELQACLLKGCFAANTPNVNYKAIFLLGSPQAQNSENSLSMLLVNCLSSRF